MKIQSVQPQCVLPGGVLRIQVSGLGVLEDVRVELGGMAAELMGVSPSLLTVRVSEGVDNILVVHSKGECRWPLSVGSVVADGLHPVSNPVVDALGNVYVTYSGARGEKVPFSIFEVPPGGEKRPFLAEVLNPTGLAIGPDNALYITSRHTGTVYRSTFDKQVEKYVDGLGLATGLAFDPEGHLLVGDRSGKIYRITPDRDVSVLCELEPSVSAFHLAVDPQGDLYVSGPTLATQDCIYRVTPAGEVSVFYKGFGRPQGLAFDPEGHLEVVASWRGTKGLFGFRDGEPELRVSGPMLVGLAHDPSRSRLYLVDHSNLYRIDLT